MIIEAEIIGRPYSGEYLERVYDNDSEWNSQSWTYIKFTNDDYSEWCGHFRGNPRQVAISATNNIILVLTSDSLFQLERSTGTLTDFENQPQYQHLSITPKGDFILADYYSLEKVSENIRQ